MKYCLRFIRGWITQISPVDRMISQEEIKIQTICFELLIYTYTRVIQMKRSILWTMYTNTHTHWFSKSPFCFVVVSPVYLYRRFISYAAFYFVSSHSLSSFLVSRYVRTYIYTNNDMHQIYYLYTTFICQICHHPSCFCAPSKQFIVFSLYWTRSMVCKKIALRHSWWLGAFEIDSFSVKDQISMGWNTWKKVDD